MAEKGREKGEKSRPVVVDEDLIVELNFVPQWARKPPEEIQYDVRRSRDRPARSRDLDRRGQRRGRRPDRPAPGPKRRERRPPPRDSAPGDRRGERRREHVEIPPVRVSFLPNQKRLAAVIQRIRSENRAFPLAAMASLFLASPDYCSVKIESDKAGKLALFRCKRCRMPALTRDLAGAHVLNEHLEDYFEKEETVSDPPSGEFVCVAKCGLSGALLGPPNHHSYEQKVREMHQSRFADMPLADYQARIHTIHDADLVEKWKEESRRKVVYRKKKRKKGDDGDVEELTWSEAVEYMEKEIVPAAVEETHRVVVGADVGRRIEDQGLMAAVRSAWRRENKNPFSLILALRGAFKHMGLHVFRAGKGPGFVASTRPRAIDPEHAVDNIREVLVHLQKCPGCTRDELVAALRPDAAKDSEEVAELLSPVGWLVNRGHIIEFFNGTLSVPVSGK